MAAMLRGAMGAQETPLWVPWAILAGVLLYFVGYVDGGVHAATIGTPVALDMVHEFFHHARHVALMCH